MSLKKKILISSLAIIALSACSSAKKEIAYSPNIHNATDFTKKMVVELSANLDKVLSKKNNREVQEGDLKYSTHTFP